MLNLTRQVAEMFVMIFVGVLAGKRGILSNEAARQVSAFMMSFVSPVLLVNAFRQERPAGALPLLGQALLLSVLFHLFCILVTKPLFPPRPDKRDRIERLAAATSNSGFMGIPLITAVMGKTGMIYCAAYIVAFSFYIWTHGIMTLKGTRTMRLRDALLAPGCLGAYVGLALFLLQVRLPVVLNDSIDYIAALNTPLSMMMMGVFMSHLSPGRTLRQPRLYWVAFLRLLALPLGFLALLLALRAAHWLPGSYDVALGVMICASCACAASTIMMPARVGGDVVYGAELVTVSTLFSILTIPLVAGLAQWALAF